jgi:hypothetical protein
MGLNGRWKTGRGESMKSEVMENVSQVDRNLGEQPIARYMVERGLKAKDLVAVSTEQITHKMVSRACRGRRLTRHVQFKIVNAYNKATGMNCGLGDLFTY